MYSMKYVIRFLLVVFAVIVVYYVVNRFGMDFLSWVQKAWLRFTKLVFSISKFVNHS